MTIKEVVKKLVRGHRYSSDTYIKYLRSIGVTIGEDVSFYTPTKILVDEQYPWMITIGNHVRICEGVKLLTHDYSWSVLKRFSNSDIPEGIILGASGKITIGNNVFIGVDSIITRDVNVGNNVIIGTGSVVTKDCEQNSVYAGVPAKKIMSISDYYTKRKHKQLGEAVELVRRYYYKYGKMPEKGVLHEYFMLFADTEEITNTKEYKCKLKLCQNERESLNYVKMNQRRFKNYREFLDYCERNIIN